MEVTEKIDKAIAHAMSAKRAALDFNYAEAALEYKNAALLLKEVLYSGKITDEKSSHLLRVKCDSFTQQQRLNESKAGEATLREMERRLKNMKSKDAATKDDLVKRFEKLKGTDTSKPVSSLEDLQARLQKLKSDGNPVASRAELEERLKALGPSQFEDEPAKTEERKMLENLIAEAGAEGTGNGNGSNQSGQLNLDLNDPMQRKIDEMFRTVEETFNIQTSGVMNPSSSNDKAVLEVMQKAADIAKYANPTTSKTTDYLEPYDVQSSNSDNSDSSLSSDSSYESDDSRTRRRRRKKKKKKKGF